MSLNLDAIGISGIYAAEAQLSATEANVTNASNPNYSAESVSLAVLPGAGGIAAGVEVLGTERAQAPFLTGEVDSQQSVQNYNQAFVQATSVAQNYLAPSSGNNLSTDLQNVINSFGNLAATPADPAVRTAVVGAATTFANDTQSLLGNLDAASNNALAQVGSLVSQVNSLTQQVAGLNSQIQAGQSGGAGNGALLDQRDALANQIAGLIGATTDASGNITVGGISLVSGSTALTLGIGGSGANIGLQIAFAQGSLPVQSSQLGGTIGGVLAGASAIDQLQSSVQGFSEAAANAINALQQNGYGLDGSTGIPLFLTPTTSNSSTITVNPAITPDNLAASSTAAGVPGDGSNAAAIAALSNAAGLYSAFPTSTLAQAFTQISSNFGTLVSTSSASQQQATATLQSLQQLKSSVTGVSLNDQLSLMIEYQNGLEAAGRAVQAANDTLSFLLQELNQ